MNQQTVVELGVIALNLVILLVSLKVHADVADLKAHVYERFVTKKEVELWVRKRD